MFPVTQVNWVDCHKLSEYLFDQYHIKVDVLELVQEMWDGSNSNGSYAEFDVSLDGPESCWEIENWTSDIGIDLIEQWLKGGRKTDLELLLWHQLYLGKIAAGKYYINIWW